jgi:hypothetical protein
MTIDAERAKPAFLFANTDKSDGLQRSFIGVSQTFIAAAFVLMTQSMSYAQTSGAGCGPNAHVSRTEKKGNETIHHCRCNPSYSRYIGACIPSACAQAFNKLSEAQKGGREALGVLGAEATGLAAAKILNWLNVKGGPTAQVLLYVAALRDAESGLDELLAYYANQPPPNDDAIWSAIRTLNDFRRLVKKTREELDHNNCGRVGR